MLKCKLFWLVGVAFCILFCGACTERPRKRTDLFTNESSVEVEGLRLSVKSAAREQDKLRITYVIEHHAPSRWTWKQPGTRFDVNCYSDLSRAPMKNAFVVEDLPYAFKVQHTRTFLLFPSLSHLAL